MVKTGVKPQKKKNFLQRRKTFLGTRDKWTNFLLWENKISELCIKNNVTIMFTQTDKHLYECLITCQSEKKFI